MASCPLALAIKRHIGLRIIHVMAGGVYKSGDVWCPSYKLPPDAKSFMSDFDNGRPVEPGVFELREIKVED